MLRLFFAALFPSLLVIMTVPSVALSERDAAETREAAQGVGVEQERKKPDAVVLLVDGDVSPETVRVRPGQTVRWENRSQRDFSLATTQKDSETFKGFRSGVIKPGKTWDYRFEKEGTYAYRCRLRPRVRGTVEVVAE